VAPGAGARPLLGRPELGTNAEAILGFYSFASGASSLLSVLASNRIAPLAILRAPTAGPASSLPYPNHDATRAARIAAPQEILRRLPRGPIFRNSLHGQSILRPYGV